MNVYILILRTYADFLYSELLFWFYAVLIVWESGELRNYVTQLLRHVFDPRRRSPSTIAASASVVASTAMVADAFATAAFVLGPVEGIAFLERHHVDGVIFSPGMDRFATAAFGRDDAAVFPDA